MQLVSCVTSKTCKKRENKHTINKKRSLQKKTNTRYAVQIKENKITDKGVKILDSKSLQCIIIYLTHTLTHINTCFTHMSTHTYPGRNDQLGRARELATSASQCQSNGVSITKWQTNGVSITKFVLQFYGQ